MEPEKNLPLPNNSNKYKQQNRDKEKEVPKVEKVVNSNLQVQKKSAVKKFADNFVNNDVPKIKSYILDDVIIPSAKSAVSTIVKNVIDILLYGESKNNGRYPADRISYNSYYDRPYRTTVTNNTINRAFAYEDVMPLTRSDAEAVLDRMYEVLDYYGFVRVSDLNQFLGITGEYTDNNFGWTSLNGANKYSIGVNQYRLSLPRPTPINFK